MKRVFLILVCVFIVSCAQEKKDKIRLSGIVFGTTYHITYLNSQQKNYQKQIDSLFALVNQSLSTYIPTSDISKINKGDTTIVVDHFFSEVFQKSKNIYSKTDGYFDPTVGNLVNAWGFGPKKAIKNLDSLKIHQLMKAVGFNKVQLVNGKIKKQVPNIFLDFNSIAKGYGIDVIGRFLERKNCRNYIVEIGGEIRARGKNDSQKPWRVAIEKPNTDGSQSFEKIIEFTDESMATSGNYRKFRIDKNGKKYAHTINPKTGFATPSNLLSASVMAQSDCADVDAFATAFMAMGFEKAVQVAAKNKDLKVLFMYLDKQGKIKEYSTF